MKEKDERGRIRGKREVEYRRKREVGYRRKREVGLEGRGAMWNGLRL